jgi:hypothetical protein
MRKQERASKFLAAPRCRSRIIFGSVTCVRVKKSDALLVGAARRRSGRGRRSQSDQNEIDGEHTIADGFVSPTRGRDEWHSREAVRGSIAAGAMIRIDFEAIDAARRRNVAARLLRVRRRQR